MLKSLEVFGFKSFADRTVFEFSRGVTCVVGPNGSGKSNVVDAIKWILGDQSPKSLRGKEMADVIFNGSASRRPSNYAEATLTFDNSGGLLPIESPEVQIGRRLYRSGDSEYLLNRNAVRLKDVRDLFMGTGAGTAAYSIIEQGRVDQLLQASPLTRRVVFEEAAGISRYKAKRVEAERRLERVSQNLERLTDIVDELDAQLASTRSQASKAARYRELSVELKQLWTGLAADTYRYLQAKLGAARQQAAALQLSYQSLTDECEQLVKLRQEADERAHAAEDQQRSFERRQSVHRQEVASATATIEHQRSRSEELQQRIVQFRGSRMQSLRQLESVRRELSETRMRLEESVAACRSKRERVTERRDSLARHRMQVEETRSRISDLQRQANAHEQELNDLNARCTRFEHDLSSLQQQQEIAIEALRRQERQWLDSTVSMDAANLQLEHAEQNLAQASADLRQLQAHHAELLAARGATDEILSKLREERSAVQARHSVLQDLAQRFRSETGLSNVDQWARQGQPPWNLVIGNVHDLLEVTLEHAPIIEAALMGRANLVVVRDLQPFLRLIEQGELRLSERLGLIELGVTTPLAVDLAGRTGVVERADRLVFEDPRAPGLSVQVLGDVWVVDSLHVARSLRSNGCLTARLVTLQGELLDVDSTLHIGESPVEVASVATRTELRELRNRLARIDRDIVDGENHSAALSHRVEGVESELLQCKEVVSAVQERTARERTAHTLQMQEHQRVLSQLEDQRQEAETIDTKCDELQRQWTAVRENRDAVDQTLREVQQAFDSLGQQIIETESTMSQMQSEIGAQEMELAKYEERLGALSTNQTRLENELAQQESHVAESIRQLHEMQSQLSRSTLTILRSAAIAAEHVRHVESLASEIVAIEAERRTIRVERNELSRREDQLQRSRRDLGEQIQTESLRIRDFESQIQSLAGRIDEEYQLQLDDLLAQGCSALHHVPQTGTDDEEAAATASSEADSVISGAQEPTTDDTSLAWLDDPDAQAQLFEQRREELDAQVQRLRRKIKLMGHVNTEALASLEELETRHSTLASQLEDLQEAKRALEDIIRRINTESQRLFIETFESIRGHFRELFRKLFGGGEADIILEDPNDVLECGIDIVARPPGKELRSISLLSGGEKTLTAVGMLFAMFKSKPSPYCVLDEVDAALDDANVERYASIVKEFRAMTQFVVITHRKRTMTAADVLYGVTMEQAGVSKRMSVKFEDVSENGDFKQSKAA